MGRSGDYPTRYKRLMWHVMSCESCEGYRGPPVDSYPTPRYRRYCAYCLRRGKRETWIGFGEWPDAGEPR